MDTVNQLTTESAVRKIVMAGISIFSFWWFSKHGTNPDPGLMNIITETLLPALLTPIAVVVDTVWSRIRQKQAALKIDTALALPPGTNNSQLNAVVVKVKDIQGKAPGLPLDAVVASAAQGIVK